MAQLDRLHRWERFVPDLGNNRELEKPFYLLVASGLTVEAFDAFKEALSAMIGTSESVEAFLDKLDAALDGFVKLGDEPLAFEGRPPIKTLREYLSLLRASSGTYNLNELTAAVRRFNSVEGTSALFYERLSGGTAITGWERAATEAPRRIH